jgi:hypothetical protein
MRIGVRVGVCVHVIMLVNYVPLPLTPTLYLIKVLISQQ